MAKVSIAVLILAADPIPATFALAEERSEMFPDRKVLFKH
jgi:hypothetical protein